MNKTFNSIKTVAIVAIAFAAISIAASFSMVANATTAKEEDCRIAMPDITVMVDQTVTIEDISVYTAECQYAAAPYKAEAIDPNDRFATIDHPSFYSLVWDGNSVEITGNEVGQSEIKFRFSKERNEVISDYLYELNRITITVEAAPAAPPTCAITSTPIPPQTVLIGTLGTQGTLDVSEYFTATNCDTPVTYTSAPTTKVTVGGLVNDATLTMDAVEGVTAGTTEDITITATSGDVTDTQVFTVTVEKAPAPECFTNPSTISTIEVNAGETVEIDISEFIEISDTCTAITYKPSTITKHNASFDIFSIEWDGSSVAITGGKKLDSGLISFSVEGLNEEGVPEVYDEWPSVTVEVKNPNPCTLTPTRTPEEIVISLEKGRELLITDYFTLSGQTDSDYTSKGLTDSVGGCKAIMEVTRIDENGAELIDNGFVYHTPYDRPVSVSGDVPDDEIEPTVSFTGATEGGTDTFQLLITAGDYPNVVELPIEVSVTVPHTCAITPTTIPDQTVTIGTQGTLDVSKYFTATNCGDTPVTYTSAPTTKVTVAGLGADDGTLTMDVIDGVTAGTTEDITITATSGDVTDTQVFTVTVEKALCTITPTTIPGQTVTIGTPGTIDLANYFTLSTGCTLTGYSYNEFDQPSEFSFDVSGSVLTITGLGLTLSTAEESIALENDAYIEYINHLSEPRFVSIPISVTVIPLPPTCVIDSTPILGQTVTIGTQGTLDVSDYFFPENCDTPVTYTSAPTTKVTVRGLGADDATLTLDGITAGTEDITITATSGSVTAEEVFTVTIDAPTPVCTITSTTIPGQTVVIGTQGTLDVSSHFTATNCSTPVTYASTQTDTTEVTVAGLGVNDATLTMDGSTAGTEDITITATSGSITAEEVFTVTVTATAPTCAITSTPIPGQTVTIGTQGTLDVSSHFTATNCDTPVTYGHTQTDTTEVTIAGLGVNDATLTMDGSTAGTEDITITATSGSVTAEEVFTVTVEAPTPIVDPTPVVDPTPETVATPKRSRGGGGGGGGSRSTRQQVPSTPVVETATQQLTVAEIEVLIKEIKEKIVQLQVIIALRLQIIEVQKRIEAHLAQA